MKQNPVIITRVLPSSIGLIAAGLLAYVWGTNLPDRKVPLRIPIPCNNPAADTDGLSPLAAGTLTVSNGTPSTLQGSWPCFRGANRDGISTDDTPLAESWATSEAKPIWSVEVGEGYAGAAIHNGRVYLMDYDRAAQADALRCLSLADGREIWRFSYPLAVKRNHGMSRTVPAVTATHVVAIGPKC
jgi:outer membrane protein assembly factor BamB